MDFPHFFNSITIYSLKKNKEDSVAAIDSKDNSGKKIKLSNNSDTSISAVLKVSGKHSYFVSDCDSNIEQYPIKRVKPNVLNPASIDNDYSIEFIDDIQYVDDEFFNALDETNDSLKRETIYQSECRPDSSNLDGFKIMEGTFIDETHILADSSISSSENDNEINSYHESKSDRDIKLFDINHCDHKDITEVISIDETHFVIDEPSVSPVAESDIKFRGKSNFHSPFTVHPSPNNTANLKSTGLNEVKSKFLANNDYRCNNNATIDNGNQEINENVSAASESTLNS